MKRLILAIISLFLLSGTAYAAGLIFAGSKLTITSGTNFNLSSTAGTIQGFATHPPTTNQTAIDAYYDKLLATGATWQRTDDGIRWSTVQSTSSTSYTWGDADLVVNRAIAKGINTVLIINGTPDWATYPGCTNTASFECAPVDANTVATFVSAVATRYLGKVHYYEIWNEPNLKIFWSPSATSTDYVSVLNASYSAIKAVDSSATVIGGVLSGRVASGSGNIDPMTFVSSMYSNNATFDIMSFHPYSYSYDVNNFSAGVTNNGFQDMFLVRNIMLSNNDTKDMWVTEYGAPTCGPGVSSGINNSSFTRGTDYMTNEAQALLFQKMISTTTSISFVKKWFAYTLVDNNSSNSSTPENCFGVYRTDGAKKPVFWVLKNT